MWSSEGLFKTSPDQYAGYLKNAFKFIQDIENAKQLDKEVPKLEANKTPKTMKSLKGKSATPLLLDPVSTCSYLDVKKYRELISSLGVDLYNVQTEIDKSSTSFPIMKPPERKMWTAFKKLHAKIQKEQIEFQKQCRAHYESGTGQPSSNSVLKSLKMYPAIMSYSAAIKSTEAQHITWYPRYYSKDAIFDMSLVALDELHPPSSNGAAPSSSDFSIMRCVHFSGQQSNVALPTMGAVPPYPSLFKNIHVLEKARPYLKEMESQKNLVSNDEWVTNLCVAFKVELTFSSSALLHLLQHLDPNKCTQSWDVPIIVKSTRGQRIVCIDKPLQRIPTRANDGEVAYRYFKQASVSDWIQPMTEEQKTAQAATLYPPFSLTAESPNDPAAMSESGGGGGWCTPALVVDSDDDTALRVSQNTAPSSTSLHGSTSQESKRKRMSGEAEEMETTQPIASNSEDQLTDFQYNSENRVPGRGYYLGSCLGISFLLRHSLHGVYQTNESAEFKFAHLLLKLEGKANIGFEKLNSHELWKSWLSVQRPMTGNVRARVDASNGAVLMIEHEDLKHFQKKFGSEAEYGKAIRRLHGLLQKITDLPAGNYMLSRKENTLTLLAAMAQSGETKRLASSLCHDIQRANCIWRTDAPMKMEYLPVDVNLHHPIQQSSSLSASATSSVYPTLPCLFKLKEPEPPVSKPVLAVNADSSSEEEVDERKTMVFKRRSTLPKS